MRTCPECQESFPIRSRTGRPQQYCGEPCRRLAEFRIRRLRAQVASEEALAAHTRKVAAAIRAGDHGGSAAFYRREAERHEAEARRAEAELRRALTDDPKEIA